MVIINQEQEVVINIQYTVAINIQDQEEAHTKNQDLDHDLEKIGKAKKYLKIVINTSITQIYIEIKNKDHDIGQDQDLITKR